MKSKGTVRRCLVLLSVAGAGTSSCSSAGPSDSAEGKAPHSLQAVASTAPGGAGNVEELDSPPSDYVRVPGGYAHPSCVHQVPNGGLVDGDDNVHDPSGNIVGHIDKCLHPSVRRLPREAQLGGALPTPPTPQQYIEGATQDLPSGSHTWNLVQAVVTVPTWNGLDGEHYFYWNGVYGSNLSDFLQPVLQWGSSTGAGGGDYWAVAAWAWRGISPLYTPLVRVNPGDQVLLQMYLDHVNPHVCHIEGFSCAYWDDDIWAILALDQTTNQEAGMWYTSGWFSEAYAATFEQNSLRSCTQASVPFSSIFLESDQNMPDLTSRVIQPFDPPNNPIPFVNSPSFPSCFFGVNADSASRTLWLW